MIWQSIDGLRIGFASRPNANGNNLILRRPVHLRLMMAGVAGLPWRAACARAGRAWSRLSLAFGQASRSLVHARLMYESGDWDVDAHAVEPRRRTGSSTPRWGASIRRSARLLLIRGSAATVLLLPPGNKPPSSIRTSGATSSATSERRFAPSTTVITTSTGLFAKSFEAMAAIFGDEVKKRS